MKTPSDILLENININKHEIVLWSQWQTLNNKIDLYQISGSTASLLNEIDSKWSTFLLHWHYTTEQKEYIKTLRLNSNETLYIIVQLDFAQNFKIFYQREVQGYHWNNKQITIFTAHLKIGDINKNIVIISDYMCHNSSFVYVEKSTIIDFIKNNFPFVMKINYISDGATSQFKNNFNIFNLAHHKHDFGLEACWTFSSSGHGKGACDGLGATVKSVATRSIITSGISISSAEEFYQFTMQYNDDAAKLSNSSQPPIHAFYISSDTVERVYNDILQPRWKILDKSSKNISKTDFEINHFLDRIKNIRSFHQFFVRPNLTIVYQHTSSSLDYKTFTYLIKNNLESSVQHIHTSNDVDVAMLVIMNYNNKFYLAQIKFVDHLTQEVQVQYYKPSFPSTTFYVFRSKNKHSFNIRLQNVLLFLCCNHIVGQQNEVYLSHEQFIDIQNLLEEF
ncbi:unnamed protein product [Rotaria sp. Silwood2]|nr:unnamed protein product [Rotaria sp. Silwood2]CAF3231702.1 unnamed protein product [Rotaria sp. Silwood2]CAF3260964.1 unnamed protein product [Rotaria sp. Silwood2]CAF3520828.1 unnamed protein product [Rotaria sp. Silwood2]